MYLDDVLIVLEVEDDPGAFKIAEPLTALEGHIVYKGELCHGSLVCGV